MNEDDILEVLRRLSARCLELGLCTADARLHEILGLLAVQVGAHGVRLYEVQGDEAVEIAAWRREPQDFPRVHRLEAFPLAFRALSTFEPALLERDDLEERTPEHQALGELGLQSVLLVPAAVRGRIQLVLALGLRERAPPWSDRTLLALRIAAEQLAHAIRRLAADREVRDQETRFRMFSEASSEGICVHQDGMIVDVNDAVVRMLRSTREAFLGRFVLDWVHPEDWPDAEMRFREGLSAIPAARLRRDDGTWVWCEITSRQVITPDGRTRLLAIRDISGTREAEQLLRESEERFRILVESTYDGIIVTNEDGIIQANPSFAQMFGYEPQEVIGLRHDDIHTPEAVERLLDRTEGSGHDAVEVVGVRKGGSLFPVLVRGRWCRMNGELVRISGYLDLTARHKAEAERRALEEQVRHVQKLESLGLLAGGIAHDFNNLLVGVLGNAELALMENQLEPTVVNALERIRSAARRASELTNQMLAYSGKGRFEIKRIDLNTRIREMTELLEVSHSKNVHLDLALQGQLWPVEGDPAQMDQIVLNLVTNASDALGEQEGTIRVATRRVEITSPGPLNVLDQPLAPGRYVVLEVSDDGTGMEDAVLERIFDPFYSTKFTGRGLGLAAVQGIVRAHEGAIEVETARGRGTTFRVWLPAAGQAELPPPTDEVPAPSVRGRVLVADDEPAVRDVTARMLERSGFQVCTVADGLRAVARVREDPHAFDVVLLDMTMPGASGIETLERIRMLRPDLPVVLCSGYAQPVRFTGELVTFLQKPFRLHDLLRALQTAREGRPA